MRSVKAAGKAFNPIVKGLLVHRRQPIVNAPSIVLSVLAVLAAIHLVRSLIGEVNDQELIWSMAFVPARYGTDGAELPGGSIARVTSLFTHMLLHGDWSHLLINSAWLLVFGTPIARRLGPVRFILFALFCGVCGALTFWIFNPGLEAPMIGASGAISGLMGGLFRFLFNALDQRRRGGVATGAQDVPRMSVWEVLRDRRAAGTIAIWVALNVALATGFSDLAPGTVAWEAHLGGFFAGLLGFGLFDVSPEPSAQPRPPSH